MQKVEQFETDRGKKAAERAQSDQARTAHVDGLRYHCRGNHRQHGPRRDSLCEDDGRRPQRVGQKKSSTGTERGDNQEREPQQENALFAKPLQTHVGGAGKGLWSCGFGKITWMEGLEIPSEPGGQFELEVFECKRDFGADGPRVLFVRSPYIGRAEFEAVAVAFIE